jgi:hypothetical protein
MTECPDWCRWHDEKLDPHPEDVHRGEPWMLGVAAPAVGPSTWLQSGPPADLAGSSVGIWLGFDATNGVVLSPWDARSLADRLNLLAVDAELYGS